MEVKENEQQNILAINGSNSGRALCIAANHVALLGTAHLV
jgi:hypothetical protein